MAWFILFLLSICNGLCLNCNRCSFRLFEVINSFCVWPIHCKALATFKWIGQRRSAPQHIKRTSTCISIRILWIGLRFGFRFGWDEASRLLYSRLNQRQTSSPNATETRRRFGGWPTAFTRLEPVCLTWSGLAWLALPWNENQSYYWMHHFKDLMNGDLMDELMTDVKDPTDAAVPLAVSTCDGDFSLIYFRCGIFQWDSLIYGFFLGPLFALVLDNFKQQ